MSEAATAPSPEAPGTGQDAPSAEVGPDLAALQEYMTKNGLTPQQALSRLTNSRKWESRAKEREDYDQVKAELDKLRQANLTQAEKDLEAARAEGRTAAESELRAKYGSALVAAHAQAQLAARGLDADRVSVLTQHMPASSFLKDDGTVDSDALTAYVDAVAPTQQPNAHPNGFGALPDFGQGRRGSTQPEPGAAGLAEAQRRFKKTPA